MVSHERKMFILFQLINDNRDNKRRKTTDKDEEATKSYRFLIDYYYSFAKKM